MRGAATTAYKLVLLGAATSHDPCGCKRSAANTCWSRCTLGCDVDGALSAFSYLCGLDVNAVAFNKVLVHRTNNLLSHILGHLYKGKLVININ